ncbi:MAG: methyltransferase domain-containing protein [Candidatus Alcyoniella australis]|nr:methyltransferase domain-containing protein [Candidatus Alcyoniella australis]
MAERNRVCPPWVGYLLLSPLRKLFENPDKLLAPHVRPGMTVIDLGCAMGFFSLPLARMVGETGKVVCVDVQRKMLDKLQSRAVAAGLSERIETHLCPEHGLGLDRLRGQVDFAVAIHVMHELPTMAPALCELYELCKPGARMAIYEPGGHVSRQAFEDTLDQARQAGWLVEDQNGSRRSRQAVLRRD